MYNLVEKENVLNTHIKGVLLACRDALCQTTANAEIILYGSYAKGQANRQSDLDLLVLLNGELSAPKKRLIHDTLYEIGLAEDVVISLIVRTKNSWDMPISKAMPLYQAIQKEGIQVT